MRIAVVGGVRSTELLVEKLHEHGFSDCHVWGYSPSETTNVSGWVDLGVAARRSGYGHTPFTKIGGTADAINDYAPDVLFAVGLSQIVPPRILGVAKVANIGFHPTALPKGRGRAAVAWLILHQMNGAATFFELRNAVDDGPILVQEPFTVVADDDTPSVYEKILTAESKALDMLLPQLTAGTLRRLAQDHSHATWFARRSPEDGWIDWHKRSDAVVRLVRASAPPHPGAFTYQGESTIRILAAHSDFRPETGVVGRILQVWDADGFVVQAADGLVRVTAWEAPTGWNPRVGMKLGLYIETEVVRLRRRCAELEHRLTALEERLGRHDTSQEDGNTDVGLS